VSAGRDGGEPVRDTSHAEAMRSEAAFDAGAPESASLVFDLDGTLVDSAPDIRAVANGVLVAEGAEPLTLAETRRFVGSGAPAFVTRMREARGLPGAAQERMLAMFLEGYEGATALSTLFPGVLDALAVLAKRGHPMGLCTNKPIGPTRAVLAHFGLAGRFATVVGGDSLPERKPDPAPLRAAFDGLGAPPGAFVGDSEIDAEAARRAALPFLLFTGGYRQGPVEDLPHTAAFDHFDALPALVASRTVRSA